MKIKIRKTPVNGGIFNVQATGEVVVPIDAELNIKKPKLFAVTAREARRGCSFQTGKISGFCQNLNF